MAGNHGGAREGAGRPPIDGMHKPLRIALGTKDWYYLDRLIAQGEYKSYAEFFRLAAQDRLRNSHNFLGGRDI